MLGEAFAGPFKDIPAVGILVSFVPVGMGAKPFAGDKLASWTELLTEAMAVNYRGYVSIELEDVDFNGTLEGEQRGFAAGARFSENGLNLLR